MKNRKVNSREYKVMLKAEKFNGDEAQLRKQVHEYWQIFSKAIAKKNISTTTGTLEKSETQKVRFYDTLDKKLFKKNNYVFRERINLEDNKREITLKFRHRDRYVSQARDMKDKDGKDKKQKFEEDIKGPIFVSLYSFSNKTKIKQDKNLNKLNDPGRLFPDLPKQRGQDYDKDQEITVVNNFTAHQIVFEGASFPIEDKTDLQCGCALIVWYDGEPNKKPVVAEFSFKYKDESEKENFSSEAAQKAFDVFQVLQEDESLAEWIDLKGPTKTKFAYEYKGKS